MAAVLFVELPSANTEAAAGDRGGFFYCAWTNGPKVVMGSRAQSRKLRRLRMHLPASAREIYWRLILPAHRLHSPGGP
jgi:hypothetical protein